MTKRLEKKSASKINAAKATRAGFSDPAVDAVFNAYPRPIKARLLALRRLIFDTAKTTKGVGALQETLKWGQPSYLTAETKSGSTIRIDQVKSAANRSILLNAADDVFEPALRHCVALALTYHLNKRKAARGS